MLPSLGRSWHPSGCRVFSGHRPVALCRPVIRVFSSDPAKIFDSDSAIIQDMSHHLGSSVTSRLLHLKKSSSNPLARDYKSLPFFYPH